LSFELIEVDLPGIGELFQGIRILSEYLKSGRVTKTNSIEVCYNNIGIIYYQQKLINTEYDLKALKLRESEHKGIELSVILISDIYIRIKLSKAWIMQRNTYR